jgi:hypothetical protein
MKKPALSETRSRQKPPRWRPWLLVLLTLVLASTRGSGDEPALTKYQIEAVFLYNFAKYVDWPAAAFSEAAAPLTIGVLGTDPFGDNLQHAVEGKTIKGRPFVLRHLTVDSDLRCCQILFISHSAAADMEKILERAAALPILTVGEDDAFAQNGGIIDFVLKDAKVRLEIDLPAARQAGLTISSRLLAVADTVTGRAK